MDIGKAFTFIFDDKKWLSKVGLGALISIVPILNFAWIGYLVQVVRNVENSLLEPLPEWGDLGEKFMKGLLLIVAGLIYALPIVILGAIFLIPAIFASGGDISEAAGAAMAGGMIFISCVVLIYSLVLSFFYPALMVNFARKGTFASCFEFSKIIKVASFNWGNYLVACIMSIVFSAVLGLLSSLLSPIICIGWIIAIAISAWASLIPAHLFGQVAQKQQSQVM
jgi:hypothetical protein